MEMTNLDDIDSDLVIDIDSELVIDLATSQSHFRTVFQRVALFRTTRLNNVAVAVVAVVAVDESRNTVVYVALDGQLSMIDITEVTIKDNVTVRHSFLHEQTYIHMHTNAYNKRTYALYTYRILCNVVRSRAWDII